MSKLTRGIVQAYLDAFNAYDITSPALQQKTDQLKQKLLDFADANPDVGEFHARFAESGLQEEYSNLVSKVAMASMGMADADGTVKTDYSDTPAPEPPSVKEFVEQYRVPYEEIKKAGYRKRGEAAYEKVFAVAERTEDMLEAQIILEEERLLWKIVSEDTLDIFEPILEAMDPLQPAMTTVLDQHVEVYKRVQGVEELDYALERLEYKRIAAVRRAVSNMTISITLSAHLMDYSSQKLNSQLSGGRGRAGEKALQAMIALRFAIRRALRFLEEELGLTFDDLLADEGLSIWMLNPQNADELGKVKEALNPQNLEAYRCIVEEDISEDLSIPELLKQTPEKLVWYALTGEAKNRFHRRAAGKADELTKDLTYYRYQEKMKHASAFLMEKEEPESKIPLKRGLFGRK